MKSTLTSFPAPDDLENQNSADDQEDDGDGTTSRKRIPPIFDQTLLFSLPRGRDFRFAIVNFHGGKCRGGAVWQLVQNWQTHVGDSRAAEA
jgi:hypothetical protein